MYALRTGLLATVVAVALASPGFAQGFFQDGQAYVVDPTGTVKTMPLGSKTTSMMMKHARALPKGTVLFLHNGQLMMYSGSGVFDRAGNWMGGA